MARDNEPEVLEDIIPWRSVEPPSPDQSHALCAHNRYFVGSNSQYWLMTVLNFRMRIIVADTDIEEIFQRHVVES